MKRAIENIVDIGHVIGRGKCDRVESKIDGGQIADRLVHRHKPTRDVDVGRVEEHDRMGHLVVFAHGILATNCFQMNQTGQVVAHLNDRTRAQSNDRGLDLAHFLHEIVRVRVDTSIASDLIRPDVGVEFGELSDHEQALGFHGRVGRGKIG